MTSGGSGTHRVRLEPLAAEHVAGLDALAQDPDVQRNTHVPTTPPPGFGRTWFEGYEGARAGGTREGFAIVDAVEGTFFGLAAAVRLDESAGEAELGYIVAPGGARPRDRDRGAAAAHRGVRARPAAPGAPDRRRNAASQRVAGRCGYTREGVLRSVHLKDGVRTDLAVYSRLPDE